MKVNDAAVKQARSLIEDGWYVTYTNRSKTQPCLYDGDDNPRWTECGRKTADDLLEWLVRKKGNRSS